MQSSSVHSTLTGQVFNNRFEIRRLLGEGSTGQVFLAFDRQARLDRALKLIDVRKRHYPMEAILRFRSEASTLQSLEHPTIIRYIDFFQEGNIYGLVMEYIPAATLQEYLKEKGPADLTGFLHILLQLTRALQYLHARSLVHHDLKSSNILIQEQTPDSSALDLRILDFGLSHLVGEQQNRVVGTLAYMAPEMTGMLNKSIDHRADLYSLGVIAYEVLTGRLPFEETDTAILMHQQIAMSPQEPRSLRPEIPDLFNRIVLKLLSKDPDDRYRSALGLQHDLERILRLSQDRLVAEVEFEIGQEDHWDSFPAHNPFLNRKDELEKLEHWSRRKRNTLIQIEGPRGIGKSALLDEFYNRLQAREDYFAHFLRPHASDQKTALSGIRRMLATFTEYLKTFNQDEQSKRVETLRNLLGSKFTLFLEMTPDLREWLGEGDPGNISMSMEEYQDVFQAFVQASKNIVQTNTFLVDDFHYLDQESARILLETLCNIVNPFSHFYITYNREFLPNALRLLLLQYEETVSHREIQLGPLSENSIASLLQKLFTYKLVDLSFLLEPLRDASGGNPRRLREILLGLIDESVIYYKDNTWYCKLDEAQTSIRATRDAVTHTGIKKFKGEALKFLRWGAVFQRAFTLAAIRAIYERKHTTKTEDMEPLEDPEDRIALEILAVLDQAVKENILVLDHRQLYYFRDHALRTRMRDELPVKETQDIHRNIALFIKSNILPTSPLAIYDIAHHYEQARDDNRAIEFYVKAARLTENDGHTDQQAQTYYNLAANKLRSENPTKISRKRAFDIILRAALHDFSISPRQDRIARDLQILEGLIQEDHVDRIRWLALKSEEAFFLGNKPEMVRFAQKAIEMSRDHMDDEIILGCLALLGAVPTGKSYPERVTILERVVTIDLRTKRYEHLIRNLSILVNLLAYLGRFDEADDWIKRCASEVAKVQPEYAQMLELFARGMLEGERGNFQMMGASTHLVDLAVEQLGPVSSRFAQAHFGRIYAMLGEYKKALKIFDHLLSTRGDTVSMGERSFALYGRMVLANRMGDCETALDIYEEAIDHLEKRSDPYKRAEFDIQAAYASMQVARLQNAHIALESAREIAVALKAPLLDAHLKFARVRLDWFENKSAESLQAAEKALQVFVDIGATGFYEIYREDFKSWQQLGSNSSTLLTGSQENRELVQLMEVNAKISAMLDSDKLLQEVLSGAMQISGAQHGYLFLSEAIDAQEKKPTLALQANGMNISPDVFIFSQSILKYTFEHNESVVTRDARKENRWRAQDSIQGNRLRSILSVPIRLHGNILGALYLDNHEASSVFTQRDREIVEHFATQAAIALNNARLFEREQLARKETEATLQIFERFIPRNFTDRFAGGDIAQLKTGISREENLSVLFTDIRNFTALSESMPASDLFLLLNDYLKFMERPVRQFHGFVDKYIGDAIMAVFDRDPFDAVQAAIGMQRAMKKLNRLRARKGLRILRSGVGINSGEVMIGVIGSRERIDTTVMGDTVNAASRIETLTKTYRLTILIGEQTYESVRHRDNLHVRFVDRVQAKGKQKQIAIYEVFNHEEDHIIRQKLDSRDRFAEAFEAYRIGDWQQASLLFDRFRKDFPEDPIAIPFVERSVRMATLAPSNWDGVFKQE